MLNKQDILENLISVCANEIEPNGVAIADQNKARHPVVFWYLGDYPLKHSDMVRGIIDNNWRANSRYIFHIGTEYESGEFKTTNLVDNSTISENINNRAYVLDDIFSLALASPMGTFAENDRVKLNIILSGNDEHFEEYIKFASEIMTSLTGLKIFKDMYILVTQGGSYEERYATDNCVRKLYDMEKNGLLERFKQVFILSNRMKNGAVLEPYKRKTCFRLIANTALMTDNDDAECQNRRSKFYFADGQLRTVSHRIVQKPCREIVVVILKTILNMVLRTEALDKDKILNMVADEQFEEDYFDKNFDKYLPTANDFMYLPYSAKGFKKILSIFNSSKNAPRNQIDEKFIDRETGGCLGEFFNMNYMETVSEKFNKVDFELQLIDNYIGKYTHRDIIDYFKREDIIDAACATHEIRIEKAYIGNFYSALARHCYLKARNEFFGVMRSTYAESMKKIHSMAENFEKLLVEMQNDIASACIIESENIYQSIEDYYSKYAYEYAEKHRSEILACLNVRIGDYESCANALVEIFNKILRSDDKKILSCGFSDELNNRLGAAATAPAKAAMIRDVLMPRIDEYTRINVAEDNVSEIYDVYMLDKETEFLKDIGDVTHFNTNDENCFEHMKLYSFGSIRDILGSRMEESN